MAQLDTLLHDLRFGLRLLRRSPGFTFVAVLTLVLGIGATTVIFSVVNAVLLRPLPFREPDRLYALWQSEPRKHVERNTISPPNYLDWRERNTAFEDMAAYAYWSFDLTGKGDPESLLGELVSRDFFGLLGVEAAHGRTFLPQEYEPGGPHVVLLSHGFWKRRFGGDLSIVGQTLSLSGAVYTVIGILPEQFALPWLGAEREVYAPFIFTPEMKRWRTATYLYAIGRLKKDVTLDQARSSMGSIATHLSEEYRENEGVRIAILPLEEQMVGKVRPMLLNLFGAVGFVLLIACANVANLLLARGGERTRELAVRAALGASRLRLMVQLLAESLLLGLLGCAGGIWLAQWCNRLVLSLRPADIPRLAQTTLDIRVLAFTAGLALLTTLLFGLAPALRTSHIDFQPALKEGGRQVAGSTRHRLRSLLVVFEIAAALVLLTGAGLLLRSFVNLMQVDPGFARDRVLAMHVYVWSQYETPEKRAVYFEQAIASVESVTGVQKAAAVSSFPLLFGGPGVAGPGTAFSIEGRPSPRPDQQPTARQTIATPGYFPAMSIPLLRGRLFSEFDKAGAPPVVLINQTMAQRYWPNEDPVGRRVILQSWSARSSATPEPLHCQIVGIVGDVRQVEPDIVPQPEYFRPHAQEPIGSMTFVVRTATDPAAMRDPVQRAIWQVNKTVPFYIVTTTKDLFSRVLSPKRFSVMLFASFAALALVLASVGIYGVISFAVSQRTHEIGVRMALGARTADVLRMVVGEGMRLAGAGVVLGLAGAIVVTRALRNQLFEITPTDPLTYVAVAGLLMAVALAACVVPARRATRVDPMTALRYE